MRSWASLVVKVEEATVKMVTAAIKHTVMMKSAIAEASVGVVETRNALATFNRRVVHIRSAMSQKYCGSKGVSRNAACARARGPSASTRARTSVALRDREQRHPSSTSRSTHGDPPVS